MSSNNNELIYLYFPKEQFEYLRIKLKPEGLLVFKEKDIIESLKRYVMIYMSKMFQSVKLDKRIEKSYEKEMCSINCFYSLVVEMNQKFKVKPIISQKLKNFRNIKNEIMKNLNLTEGKVIECDPFSLLKPSKANKQLLPKWGISFTDDQEKINEYHSDDEDDELVFEKQEKPKTYVDYIIHKRGGLKGEGEC